MLQRTRRITKNAVGAALCGLALALAACRGGGFVASAPVAVPAELRALVADREVLPVAPLDRPPVLPAGATVVVVTDGPRPSGALLAAACRPALVEHVQRGGRLLLLGHAAALVGELGVDASWPDRSEVRWGFDQRAVAGRTQLGIELVSGRAAAWFDGLVPATGHEFVHFLAERQPAREPVATWRNGPPASGEVLAALAVAYDDLGLQRHEPVLVRWSVGAGEVVALGLLPDVAAATPSTAANARRLADNLLGSAGRGNAAPLVVWSIAGHALPQPTAPAGELGDRELPAAPQWAHWGWQARTVVGGDPQSVRPASELVGDVLLPSWLAGADLLGVDLAHDELGGVLPWASRDPLPPPPGYRGGSGPAGWTARAFGELAKEAHARGLLVHGWLETLPVGDVPQEQLVLVRHLARELADVRRLGQAAVDGLAVRSWWPDQIGLGAAMLQSFQPRGAFVRSGELAPIGAASPWAGDADDGAPRGVPFGGAAAGWRDDDGRALRWLAVLEARARPAAARRDGRTSPWQGAEPDWLVRQAHDFLRPRLGQGPAAWWRAHDPASLGADTAAYVHALGTEGLRAALAMPLAATGQGGLRAAVAQLEPGLPAAFANPAPAPAAVHTLQNNWLRLLGSGGALAYDPLGLARFDAGAAIPLSPALLRTRLSGARPIGDVARRSALDLLSARREPVVLTAGGPAAAYTVLVPVEAGYHELELVARAVDERGLCTIRLDGALLHSAPFAVGEAPIRLSLPVHAASPGERRLVVEAALGGMVAVDQLRLLRRGDVGAEASVRERGGVCAALRERSASSYHHEELDFRMLADQPGFLLAVRCERAVRNLRVERTFALPAYVRLAAADEAASELRSPFVLAGDADGVPDLVVAPLLLPRYERFAFAAGALQLHGAPEPGAETRVMFLFVPRGHGLRWRSHARALGAALERPTELDLADGREALLTHDLPMAWTRAVRLAGGARTPVMVRENGWWTWRGTQASADGSAYLRVVHLPGDEVAIATGASLLQRTRPGPGALQVVALREVGATTATVRVLQPSRLAVPSVTFAQPFDEVFVDDVAWAHHDGRTVRLPDVPGTYRVRTGRDAGGSRPHVVATSAPLRRCEYSAAGRVLQLVTAPDPERPPELPYTAVLGGPRPVRIDNGELVPDDELRFADAAARAAAAAGGTLVRFRAGTTEVHYGP